MPAGNTIAKIVGQLILQENGCLIWPKSKNPHGYGVVGYGGKSHLVHKLLYEHFVGPVPAGLMLDHFVCQTRACGNVAHLEPVTPRENVLRGRSAIRGCSHGEEYWTASSATCRICRNARDRERSRRYREDNPKPKPTHCRHGHELTPENTVFRPAQPLSPRCRTCARMQGAQADQKRKEAKNRAARMRYRLKRARLREESRETAPLTPPEPNLAPPGSGDVTQDMRPENAIEKAHSEGEA